MLVGRTSTLDSTLQTANTGKPQVACYEKVIQEQINAYCFLKCERALLSYNYIIFSCFGKLSISIILLHQNTSRGIHIIIPNIPQHPSGSIIFVTGFDLF